MAGLELLLLVGTRDGEATKERQGEAPSGGGRGKETGVHEGPPVQGAAAGAPSWVVGDEVQERKAGGEPRVRDMDGDRCSATVAHNGKAASQGTRGRWEVWSWVPWRREEGDEGRDRGRERFRVRALWRSRGGGGVETREGRDRTG
ncbi:hypothetical protein TRIUR3_33309 [Triticum urartu]|uniref:Uncharacterized protein n=1 Tax=Triticum urartu TaxID=4572 RepID=M7YTU3_TRIUA|nr:hypothetical protein TRIUR3_33309 [Triticum urartu]